MLEEEWVVEEVAVDVVEVDDVGAYVADVADEFSGGVARCESVVVEES